MVASSWRRSYGLVLVATVALVAAADFLTYGHTPGWTFGAMTAAFLIALAMRNTSFLRSTGGRLFAIGAVGLVFALIEQPTSLNVLYALVCLAALSLTNTLGWESNFWPWVTRVLNYAVSGWVQLFLDNGIVMRWLMRHGFSPRIARVIAAWIVPVLLASVFVALFGLANPVIASWLSIVGNWLGDLLAKLPDFISVPRILFWCVFAIFAWMILRGRGRLKASAPARTLPQSIIDAQPAPRQMTVSLVVRCLILFNLVFAVENVLDLRYLYAPDCAMPTGTTYKQYVRRGAYPLVAAALLAGAFVLVTFRPESETERSSPARKLVYIWIGQTILLTVSAAWRLEKYVELTELTRLRVASAVWFLLVGMGLFYIVWRIARNRSNAWLINVNAVTALLVLYPCCFINFDGIIADFNAVHCEEAGGPGSPLDIEYFADLGTPALAALDSVRDKIEIGWRREAAKKVSDEMYADLHRQLADWREWTWRRQRSLRAADAVAQARSIRHDPHTQLASRWGRW